MDQRPGSKLFAIGTIVVFALAIVMTIGPCTMLFDHGLDPGPGKTQQSWSLGLVLWAAAEMLVTPFLVGCRLNLAVLPRGRRATTFLAGIALVVGGMFAIGVTFGPRLAWLKSPWPPVVAGALGIIVGTRLARMALFPRRE